MVVRLGLQGALLEGNPAFGSWSMPAYQLPRNVAGFLSPEKRPAGLEGGHHVLVRSDSMTVVAYINHQGGLRSHSLYRMARRLLLWAQNELLSLRAVHVPGSLNLGADMLSRSDVAPGDWTLHPQMDLKIWSVLGMAEVDPFAS